MKRPGKRIKVLLVLAFLAVGLAVGLFLLSGGETEPSWEGRSLSEWLVAVQDTNSTATFKEQARTAVRRMDTNVFPFVLKWAAYEPPKSSPPLDASSGNRKALMACVLLGSNAAPILHDLARIAAAGPKTVSGGCARLCIWDVLFFDSNKGGKLLQDAFSDPDPILRRQATNVLNELRSPTIVPPRVGPALKE